MLNIFFQTRTHPGEFKIIAYKNIIKPKIVYPLRFFFQSMSHQSVFWQKSMAGGHCLKAVVTVKLVYNGHPWDSKKVSVDQR